MLWLHFLQEQLAKFKRENPAVDLSKATGKKRAAAATGTAATDEPVLKKAKPSANGSTLKENTTPANLKPSPSGKEILICAEKVLEPPEKKDLPAKADKSGAPKQPLSAFVW